MEDLAQSLKEMADIIRPLAQTGHDDNLSHSKQSSIEEVYVKSLNRSILVSITHRFNQ